MRSYVEVMGCECSRQRSQKIAIETNGRYCCAQLTLLCSPRVVFLTSPHSWKYDVCVKSSNFFAALEDDDQDPPPPRMEEKQSEVGSADR